MRKFSIFGVIVIAAMLLAACAGSGTNATPTSVVGGGTGLETTAPGGVSTSAPAGGLTTETSTVSTTAPGGVSTTESTSSVPSTGGLGTSSVPATGGTSVVGTPMMTSEVGTSVSGTSVPSTGGPQIGDFARLQDLMNLSIMDANNNSLGTIQDFIINIPKTRVDWVIFSYNGNTVAIPWSSLTFNRSQGSNFVFNGNMTLLQNAPAFNSSSIDWTSETWDTDMLNYWASGAGASTTVAGTSVPSIGGTEVSTSSAGSASTSVTTGMTGTSTVGTSTTGSIATTGARQVAILASQLTSVQVVEGGATGTVPSTGGMTGTSMPDMSGTSTVTGTTTAGSSSSMTGTSTVGGSTSGVPTTGGVGNLADGVVALASGNLPYYLISADNMTGVGMSVPSTGSSMSSTPMVETSTVGTSMVGTTVPTTGTGMGGRFIAVPANLLVFTGNNQAVLQVPLSLLQNAPVIDFSQTSVLNLGWDAQIISYWSSGSTSSNGSGTSTGTATTTP